MIKYLKERELRALLMAPENIRDALILRLLYLTGMRIGELTALQIRDIDLDEGTITIQTAKRHKEGRIVPIPDKQTILMLRQFIGDRNKWDYVFVSRKDPKKPISTRQIERMFYRYAREVGIDKDKRHPHILRHTHAVMSLKSGIDLRTLQLNLGHASINTTAIYLTLDIEDRKEAYQKSPIADVLEP